MSAIVTPKRNLILPRRSLARQRGFFSPAGFVRTPPYSIDAVDADGTNDQMNHSGALSGVVDGKTGIISAWFQIDAIGSVRTIFSSTPSNKTRCSINASGQLEIQATQSTGLNAVLLRVSGTFAASSTWWHLLSSWDLTGADTANAHMYLDDADVAIVGAFADANIQYTGITNFSAGGSAVVTSARFDGGLAELYFAPNQFLDFSIEANRRKFISADGKPVNLGADGSRPTGTAPAVYMSLADGGTANDFATNRGTGGSFTLVGSYATRGTSPSD